MNFIAIPNFFRIDSIFFELLHYPVSYLEFAGTISGLISVALAARSNIWTWATGLVNVTCFFLIFFQVQLYSDMFLQVYFFAASIYGWVIWKRQDKQEHHLIRLLPNLQRLLIASVAIFLTLVVGLFISKIHLIFPSVFAKPASFPYLDTFIALMSILATLLLAQRIWENWTLWIAVDVLSTGLYAIKGVKLIAIEYFIFLCLAAFGLYNWTKLLKNDKRIGIG